MHIKLVECPKNEQIDSFGRFEENSGSSGRRKKRKSESSGRAKTAEVAEEPKIAEESGRKYNFSINFNVFFINGKNSCKICILS